MADDPVPARPASGARPARALFRAALAVAAVLLAVVAAAQLYRVRMYGPGALGPEGMNSIRTIGEAGMTRAAEPWELRYELRPDLDVTFKLARFRTNAFGLRDDPCSEAKPEGGYRAAFVGDSFTMGSGVEHADLFHSRIEAAWREAQPGRSIECLNFGVAGYNLLAYAGVVRHKALAFEPDLVVVCLVANDFKEPHQRPGRPPYEPRALDYPFWRLHLLELLDGGPVGGTEAGLLPWPATRAGAAEPGSAGREVARSRPAAQRGGERARKAGYVLEQLRSMAEACAGRGAELALVYLCHESDAGRAQLGQELADYAAALGIPYCDTQPLFAGEDPSELRIFPDDAHPNARANALFAAGIRAFLEERGLGPAADEALGD